MGSVRLHPSRWSMNQPRHEMLLSPNVSRGQIPSPCHNPMGYGVDPPARRKILLNRGSPGSSYSNLLVLLHRDRLCYIAKYTPKRTMVNDERVKWKITSKLQKGRLLAAVNCLAGLAIFFFGKVLLLSCPDRSLFSFLGYILVT